MTRAMAAVLRAERIWVRSTDDAGFSMVATVLSLLVVSLLVLFGAEATFGSSDPSSTGSSVHRPLSEAAATQAQQTLSTGLATVGTVVGVIGSYGGIDASALQASEPSITFVDGPSIGPNTVSVASTTDGSGSVTLASVSSDGTCWFAWQSSESGAWFGAQIGGRQCAARPMESTPIPGPVSASSIGWQEGSFPSA
jgi:hypothetical protein